jgi:hypothetical protein
VRSPRLSPGPTPRGEAADASSPFRRS